MLLLSTNDVHSYGGGELTLPPGVDATVEHVMTEPSWDMSAATMLALAHRVRDAAESGAVVVAHGADTVEETAFLTDLVAGPTARAGIVFTTELSRAAFTAAADPRLRQVGAVVCCGALLHAARWATHAGGSFTSAPFAPVAHVTGNDLTLGAAPPARPPAPRGRPVPDVALLKTYPGMDATLLMAAVDAGAAGIVLEGTGPGNVPASLFAAISDLTEWGVPVVIASRSHVGPSPVPNPDHAHGLAFAMGAVSARGLSAPKARAALMVALGAGSAARAWFAQL
ncbi:asparaginase domain-containing protein [Actinoplanes sp. NPDC024001]|uniref:asparaginase n=1 Tax=Actinoplanes sp. NPDC024001 TaxID=3154598 RepID=UPI0033E56310